MVPCSACQHILVPLPLLSAGVPPAVPSPYAQPSAVWQQGGFFPLAPEPSAHSAPTKGTSGSWSYVHGHLSSQGSGSEVCCGVEAAVPPLSAHAGAMWSAERLAAALEAPSRGVR